MPVYEYQCKECGHIEEAFQKISEPPLEICPQCKGSLKKLISQSSFHLKGSGWYVTDYGGAKSGTNSGGTKEKTASKSENTASKSGVSK
ncbi:MAG: zinc ribbon domain-containing protein [Desulfobacter sp.]|nr:MAG: zinc ribbon domain-containing protein [Desulfobacter sp.]